MPLASLQVFRSHTHLPLSAMLLAVGLMAVATSGCASTASGSLRAPLLSSCQREKLAACEEMTEGVVQYLDGQTIRGSQQLLAGGAKNSAAGRERYASLLERTQGLRSASKYKRQLAEVVLVLGHAESQDEARAPEHIVTAETDLEQARDGTVPPPATTPEWCSSNFGADAKCVMATRGPLFVTDIVSVGLNCRGQFASVLRGGSVRAHIEGPFDQHGGRLLLTPADTLVFGQKAAPVKPAPPPLPPEPAAPPSRGARTPAASSEPAPPPPPAPVKETAKDDCPVYWSGYVPYRDAE